MSQQGAAERMKEALELLWLIHLKNNTHLGYERFSGIAQECPACICALALGRGMGHATAEDFAGKREKMLLKLGEKEHAK